MMRESIRNGTGPCALSAEQQKDLLSRLRVNVPRIIAVATADTIAYVLYDRFDVDIIESAADSAAQLAEPVVPMPKRFGRDWEVVPPAFLPLRHVGGVWKVGPAMDWGGMSATVCNATGGPQKKKKKKAG
jgi:hypothetical protein